jgi:hypothetical protein
VKINKTLTVFSLCSFAFISASSFFGEAEAASIKKATIKNGLAVGAANDVTLGFSNKVSMVNIMVPGGVPIMCNQIVVKPGPPPVLSDFTYKCDGFILPNTGTEAEKSAMVTYKTECDVCKLTEGQWSRDGKDAGPISITNPGITIKKGSIDVTFFNDQLFSVTYQNIQVFESNNIANFNLSDFANPTGILVSGIPSSITLNANESYTLTINNIVEDLSTYVLATSTFFPTNDPTDIGQVATATDFTPSVCVPEPTLTLALLALGTLGAASTLKRKLKPSQSIEKETTKVG